MNSPPTAPKRLAIAMQRQLDADLFREHFLLSGRLNVVLSTTDLEDFEGFCRREAVCVALVDLGFPGHSALDVSRRLLARQAIPRFLFLDRQFTPFRAELVQSAHGAYCSRSISLNALSRFVERLSEDRAIGRNEMESLLNHEGQWRVDGFHEVKLSNREIEMWTLIGEGLRIADCAKKLGIAKSTADNHKWRLMKKLKVNKSVALARLAVQVGLVD
jgi:two-component system invasion response regulator UvrY